MKKDNIILLMPPEPICTHEHLFQMGIIELMEEKDRGIIIVQIEEKFPEPIIFEIKMPEKFIEIPHIFEPSKNYINGKKLPRRKFGRR